MRERLYYFFRSKIFIIISITLASLLLIGFGIWGGLKIFKGDEEKVYYKVNGFFIDDSKNFISGVKIKVNGVEVATSNEYGGFILSYLEEGSEILFEIDGYTFEQSNKIIVTKNIYNLQVNLISSAPKIKQFIAKVIDENGAAISNVSVKENNKKIGTTDYKGEFKVNIQNGNKTLTFEHEYFNFNENITYNYEDDEKVVKEVVGTFNSANYFKTTIDDEGNPITRSFKVGFTFRTIDGEIIRDASVYYKLKDSETFNHHAGIDLLYLEKEFTSAFAYYYNETTNTWYCSEIIKPSPIGTTIYLKEAIHIDAKINLQDPPSLRTIFTSNGYYFLSDTDGNIEIVLPSYQDIQFYHDMEYGKYPKYEVILVDSEGNPITEVEGNISNVNFIIK